MLVVLVLQRALPADRHDACDACLLATLVTWVTQVLLWRQQRLRQMLLQMAPWKLRVSLTVVASAGAAVTAV